MGRDGGSHLIFYQIARFVYVILISSASDSCEDSVLRIYGVRERDAYD